MRKTTPLLLAAFCVFAATLIAAPAVAQWSTPVNLSQSTDKWTSELTYDFDSSGNIHIAYYDWNNSNKYAYYATNMGGSWSKTLVHSNAEQARIVVTQTDQTLHYFYKTGGNFYHIYKPVSGGSWSTPERLDTYPEGTWIQDVAVDANDGIMFTWLHLFDDSISPSSALWGRYKPYGQPWGAVELVAYESRENWPIHSHLSVHGGEIWAVYAITGSGGMRYKVRSGGSWGSEHTFTGDKLAWSPSGELATVYAKQTDDPQSDLDYDIFARFSYNNGGSWTSATKVGDSKWISGKPWITYDQNGDLHIFYMNTEFEGDDEENYYVSRRNGQWMRPYKLTSNNNWNAHSYHAAQVDNNTLYYIYSDKPSGLYDSYITQKSVLPDTTPPGPVTDLSIRPTNHQNEISWRNPDVDDYVSTMIRYRTDTYPTSPTDGTLIYDEGTRAGQLDSFTHTGLTNGQTYYYTLFTYDAMPLYSQATISGAPTDPPLANMLTNGNMSSMTGGVADGWTTYTVNDPLSVMTFSADSTRYNDAAPSQKIMGIDHFDLPVSGLSACGMYQVVTGTTPGKVYQVTGYPDIWNINATTEGTRYLTNFGFNPTGGTDPGTLVLDGTIGGTIPMKDGRGLWNSNGGGSVRFGSFHRAISSFPAEGESISVWAGLTIDNTADIDAAQTQFNVDDMYVFEWDFSANPGLQNGNFEGTVHDLQNGGDTIPDYWVPCGGGIGEWSMWHCDEWGKRTGNLGVRIGNRRGIHYSGMMQKVAVDQGYNYTFSAYGACSGIEYTEFAVGIDPYGEGNVNSDNIVWTTSTASSWTQISVSTVAINPEITVFIRASNEARPDGQYETGSYHNAVFDDCALVKGTLAQTGTISGHVYDTAMQPVYGSRVATLQGGFEVFTGTDGSYTIPGVYVGTYDMEATKGYYDPDNASGVVVTAGNTTTVDFTITAQPCSITGTVTDASENPISGATVYTSTGGYSTTTLSDGTYTIPNVAQGTYNVTAAAPYYDRSTVYDVETAPGPTTVNFTLSGATYMSCAEAKYLSDGLEANLQSKIVTSVIGSDNCIYVEDDDRKAGIRVAGASSGIAVGDLVDVMSGLVITTESEGVDSERVIQGASVFVTGSDTPMTPVGMTGKSVGGTETTFEAGVVDGYGLNNVGLLVKTTGSITHVVDNDSFFIDDGSEVANELDDTTAVTGVKIKCYNTSGVAAGDYVAVTGIVEGSVPSGWSANRRQLRVDPSNIQMIDTSRTIGNITGYVKDTSDQPVGGALVQTSAGGYWAYSNADGSYTLANVNVGTYNVTASCAGYSSQTETGVAVTDGATTTVNFALPEEFGAITGYVKDTVGAPVSGATVSTDHGGYSTTTASDGTYTLSNVIPDTYSVTASKTGYNPLTNSSVVVPPGTTVTSNFDNMVALPGSITGYVRDVSNNPISGAQVWTDSGGYSTTSASDGSYTLSNVGHGTYTVYAKKWDQDYPGTNYHQGTVPGVIVAPGGSANASFNLNAIVWQQKVANSDFQAGFFSFWGGQMAYNFGACWNGSWDPSKGEWQQNDSPYYQKIRVVATGFEMGINQEITGLTPGARYTFKCRGSKRATHYAMFMQVRPGTGYGSTIGVTGVELTNCLWPTWETKSISGTVPSTGSLTILLWTEKTADGSTESNRFDLAELYSW